MNKGIQKIFSEVPRTYERVNHILTFGLDFLWRKEAARIALQGGGRRWLDVCSGTGETAVNLQRLAGPGTQVFAADFSMPMLRQAMAKPEAKSIRFVLADIKQLPFAGCSVDLITISFATRNINLNRDTLLHCFKEFHRVLRPGGTFLNLETSQPGSPLIKSLFHRYIKLFVKPIGYFFSGSKAAYAYLSETIPAFYSAPQLAEIMESAGFLKVEYNKLFLGIAAIHQGNKL